MAAKKKAKVVKTRVVKPKPRPVFVYAEDLRVGDVIELHGSMPIGKNWVNTKDVGDVRKVDKKTSSLYSKTIVHIRDTETGDKTVHSLSNMTHIKLVGVTL